MISLGGGGYDRYYRLIVENLALRTNKFNYAIIYLKGEYKKNTINYFKKFDFIKLKTNKSSILLDLIKCKFSILSGGYHKIESNYLKIPSIFVSTQKHQDVLLKNFTQISNQDYICYNEKNFDLLLNKYLIKMFSQKKSKVKKIINNYNEKFLKNLLG